jgi:hypothetical protein
MLLKVRPLLLGLKCKIQNSVNFDAAPVPSSYREKMLVLTAPAPARQHSLRLLNNAKFMICCLPDVSGKNKINDVN